MKSFQFSDTSDLEHSINSSVSSLSEYSEIRGGNPNKDNSIWKWVSVSLICLSAGLLLTVIIMAVKMKKMKKKDSDDSDKSKSDSN